MNMMQIKGIALGVKHAGNQYLQHWSDSPWYTKALGVASPSWFSTLQDIQNLSGKYGDEHKKGQLYEMATDLGAFLGGPPQKMTESYKARPTDEDVPKLDLISARTGKVVANPMDPSQYEPDYKGRAMRLSDLALLLEQQQQKQQQNPYQYYAGGLSDLGGNFYVY